MEIPDFTEPVEVTLTLTPNINLLFETYSQIAEEEGIPVSTDGLIVLAHYGSKFVNSVPALRAYLRTEAEFGLEHGYTVDSVKFKAFCKLFEDPEGDEVEVDSLARVGKILEGKLKELDRKHFEGAIELFEDLPEDEDED